ncbi:DNA polymerase/3'-5' exonuclease PolX [Tuberibacillus sp. Marseille-P3662]|uniref:DNA polymerase/3'-5' exonuclease PolX n=1 Tax=Tuberibacillus sp. Marseille-P3662 TaxID=1965358 RepID=UPI000A1CA8A9|nr:DNA polymerase/3'-5' exonuclease PolX [Tuberibacillus sp. Marseille-P3662]
MLNKKQVIKALEDIAVYLELKGENPFKISAYRKAAGALETDDRSMGNIDDPGSLKGIGKGTAQVINELVATGESQVLNDLREEIPAELPKLLRLPGLGGKKIAKLYQLLGVIDLNSLKQACLDGRVSQLEGFGKKSEEKLLQAIDEYNVRPERLPIAYMMPMAEKIESVLARIDAVDRYAKAGSIRRFKEMMKDLDFVVATDDPQAVADGIKALIDIHDISGEGETKMTIILNDDYQVSVDFRFVAPQAFATAWHHFTGSKDHNVNMRQLAKAKNESISEYGVLQHDTGELLSFVTEQAFFNHFDLDEIPPEVREGRHEIEVAGQEAIKLVQSMDIKSDCHMHTTWSDGAFTVEEMAEAARNKGYEYIMITDHSKSLRVANGLTETRLRQQREEIERLNATYNDFHIYAGVEMDILPDGSLDYSDDMLQELDFVIAAIHTSFAQDRTTIMKRLDNALQNPYVKLIAHPTGRIIGGRKGYDVDIEHLIDGAWETGTALELNANLNRLDLAPEWLAKARDRGVTLAVNTDAHAIDMLDDMRYGVSAARRAWLEPTHLLNCKTRQEMDAFLKQS